MNRYVDILNRIRQNVNLDWLTPSQQVAYNWLCERLKFLDEVNLWGEHGVGKTFIGWVLQAQGLAVYTPRLEDAERIQTLPLHRTIIVDNLGWRRSEVRDALYCCRSLGYDKIVLITTECVQEQMAAIQLSLTDEDIQKVITNLRSIGVAPYDDAPRNLWDIISPISLKE